MLRNYLVTAWRNLLRHKLYSFINIAGLAVGIAVCLLILLYVQDELSYDRYHEKAARIYRVVREQGDAQGHVIRRAIAPIPMAPALAEELPAVQSAVRFARGKEVVRYGEKMFYEPFFFVDANVFDVFDFPLLSGDPGTALVEPFTLVMTESIATKYFGDEEPLGKWITLGNGKQYKITGILKEVPANSHFRFSMLASLSSLRGKDPILDDWKVEALVYTYILLAPSYTAGQVEHQLPLFTERHLGSQPTDTGETLKFHLQPLTSIHLHSNLSLEIEPNSDIVYIYVFSTIALLVLLIACFNFVNLATARAGTRSREVGVRKAVGAGRRELIGQFLGEAVLLALLAALFAVLLVEMLLPGFDAWTGKELSVRLETSGIWWAGIVGMALLAGLVSGVYPAFCLADIRATQALKGTFKTGPGARHFRKALVALQLAVAITLVISTGAMYAQVRYIKKLELGFVPEQLVILPLLEGRARSQYAQIKSALLSCPSVLHVSAASDVPFRVGRQFELTRWPVLPEGWPEGGSVRVPAFLIDADYVETIGASLVAGRNLDPQRATDATSAFLVNETAVEQFGWGSPEAALGRGLTWNGTKKGTVVGVVRDFHVQSLYQRIEPMVFHLDPEFFWAIVARIRPDRVSDTLDFLREKWQQFAPDRPFEYFFVDDYFADLHRTDERTNGLLGTFSLLAIFVTCLGLFGLVTFAAEQRTKEIGIRKVLGASVPSIVVLLSREFTYLVLTANLIAWPIAWYAMHRWLESFAYRIELGLGVFALGGLLVLGIAWLTVSYQAIRAALANPVEALRYE